MTMKDSVRMSMLSKASVLNAEHIKIFSGILIFLITLNTAQATIITVENRTTDAGRPFLLNVSIDQEGSEIAGLQMNIMFDPAIVTVNNVIEGDLLRKGGLRTFYNEGIIDNSAGIVRNNFNAIIGPYNVSDPGTYASISLMGIGEGRTNINLSGVKISDPGGQEVAYSVSNGSVNIRSAVRVSTDRGGGSESTGESGIITSELLENIEGFETIKGQLIAGRPVTYKFLKPDRWIYEIVVTGNRTQDNIAIRIEDLKRMSGSATVPHQARST